MQAGDVMNKVDSLAKLYSTDYNLTRLFAMKQFWKNGRRFSMNRPRPTNALFFLCGCEAVYNNNLQSIKVPCGSLFFMPKGSTYSWTFYNAESSVSALLFEFIINDDRGDEIAITQEAGILPFSDYGLLKILFENIIDEFQKPLSSPPRIKAAAFSLISSCASAGRKNEIKNGNLRLIYNGIKYLENEPVQQKSISEIAAMCNVSTNYFERLFKEYAGCTPSRFRQNKRIERAKLLLEVDTMSIQQVALESGFEDVAYFCRVFKNVTGYTPNQYRNIIPPRP